MKASLHFSVIILFVVFINSLSFGQDAIFRAGMEISTFGTYDDEPNDPLVNAIDGDKASKFLNHAGNTDGTGIQINLNGGTAIPTEIEITTGNDAGERDPSSVIIWGSNDGDNWTEISTVALTCDLPREAVTKYSFENTESYGQFKLHFDGKCNEDEALFQIMEVQLYGTAIGVFAPKPIFSAGMEISTFGTYDDEPNDPLVNAIDGNKGSKFLNHAGNTDGTGIQINLSDGVAVPNAIEITTGNDAGERDPSSVIISGSNDGDNWTKISTVALTCDLPREAVTKYFFNNTEAYAQFRLHFDGKCNEEEALFQIMEVQLYGDISGIIVSDPIFSAGMEISTFGTYDDEPNDPLVNAIDGDKTTKFLNHAGNVDGTGIQIYLGASTAIPNSIEITTGNDAGERDPSSVIIWGSNDGDNWTEISTVALTCDLPREAVTKYSFENTESYGQFRLHFDGKCNEGEALFQIMEVQLYGEIFTVSNEVITETAIVTPFESNDSPEAEGLAQAFDGSTDSKWLNFNGNQGSGFIVDLGNTAVAAIQLSLTTANDAPERDPGNYIISGSNNGIIYTDIAEGTIPCIGDRFVERTFDFSNSVPYSFYKVSFPSLCSGTGQNLFQVAEVQLYHDGRVIDRIQNAVFSKGLSVTPYGDTYRWENGESPDKAFDEDEDTKYFNFEGANGTGFTVDLDDISVVAKKMMITTGNDAPERDPSSYEVFGSNDGVDFTSIGAGEIPCDDTRFNTSLFDLNNSTSYSMYRINFPTLCGGEGQELFQVAEVQLIHDGIITPIPSRKISNLDINIIAFGGNDSPAEEGVAKVFDNDLNTKWLNFAGNNGSGIVLELEEQAVVASEFRFTTANDAPERDPSSYIISGSVDGDNYVELGTGSIDCNGNRFLERFFQFDNTNAYSYYKISFPTLCNGDQNLFQISGLELIYDGEIISVASKKIFQPGMSVTPYGETVRWEKIESPDNAFDNDVNSKYFNFDGGNGTGFTVELDKFSAAAVELQITTGNDSPERDPSSFEVFGSNDGIEFSLIGSGEIACSDVRFNKTTYDLENTIEYSYYRVNFPTLCGGEGQTLFQVAEVQLLHNGTITEKPGKKIFKRDGVVFTAFESNNSPEAENVLFGVDNNVDTKWLNFDGQNGSGFTVEIAGAPLATNQLRIITANDFGERDPANYVVYGSNDGIDFTEIATGDIPCDERRHLERSFDIDNSTAYSFYKVSFPTLCNSGQNVFQVADIQLIEGAVNTGVENFRNAEVSVYPNPTNGRFVVEIENELVNSTLRIFNSTGKVIKEDRLTSLSSEIDLSGNSKGIYFINISSNKNSLSKKIVVK